MNVWRSYFLQLYLNSYLLLQRTSATFRTSIPRLPNSSTEFSLLPFLSWSLIESSRKRKLRFPDRMILHSILCIKFHHNLKSYFWTLSIKRQIPLEWLQVKICSIPKTEANQYHWLTFMFYVRKIVETIFNTRITCTNYLYSPLKAKFHLPSQSIWFQTSNQSLRLCIHSGGWHNRLLTETECGASR